MPGTRIGAIILAAGSSSRLGTPKQLLHFRGESLLRRAARAALDAGCTPVIIVTGANAALSRHELADLGVHEAYNSQWRTGLGSSICAGVEALVRTAPDVAATLILLCDQPYVTPDVLSGLITVYRVAKRAVVASTYGGSAGTPALFDRALFHELARLDGAVGAKHVIGRHPTWTQLVPFPEGEWDVDTPSDLEWLRLNPRVGRP